MVQDDQETLGVRLELRDRQTNEIVFETALGLLYALEKDGKNSAGFPRKLSGGTTASPQLLDYLADRFPHVGAETWRARIAVSEL